MIPADKEEDSWLANQVWGADGGPWGPMVPASACEGWGRGPMDLLDLSLVHAFQAAAIRSG